MPSEKPGDITTLLEIMAKLRDPENGCPWDRQQTMQSLTRFTIEEAYEVVDAIEKKCTDDIRDELGDLLFQIVFYSQIAAEQNAFTFDSVVEAICAKLTRRHPHVFEGVNIPETELEAQWHNIKQEEKSLSGNAKTSVLDDISNGLPALMHAQKIQKHCARVGFDWDNFHDVLDKVQEEVTEIRDELDADKINQSAVEEEIGDAFFALVNLSRHCNVDADTALRKASKKFISRFKRVEQLAQTHGHELTDMTLAEMEKLWQQAKNINEDK